MPRFSSEWIVLQGAVIVTLIVAVLGGRWLRRRYPGVMGSIWLQGVAIPLFLIALTVASGLWFRHWYYSPLVLGAWAGTIACVAHMVARDPGPIHWWPRSDVVGRLGLVIGAACLAWFGAKEASGTFGSPGWSQLWYALAFAHLVAAVVLKPEWVRSAFRPRW